MTNAQRALIEGLLTFFVLTMVAGLIISFSGNEAAGLSFIGFGVAGVLSLCVAQWRLQRSPLERNHPE